MIETPADYRSFAFLGQAKLTVSSLRSGFRSFAFLWETKLLVL